MTSFKVDIGLSHFDNRDPQTLAKQSLYKLAYCAGSHALEEILAIHRLASSNTAGEQRELIQRGTIDCKSADETIISGGHLKISMSTLVHIKAMARILHPDF